MNNADMPAMPINTFKKAGDLSVATNEFKGLTKREKFAAMAMQGLLASDEYAGASFEIVAKESVLHAGALLEELSK